MNNIRVMCNTSPIIGLLSIKQLPLLWSLFKTVLIPQAVYDELCVDSDAHQDDIDQVKSAVRDGHLSIYQVTNRELVSSMYGRLHYGELEVIVGAKECGIKLAVMDDLAARKFANEMMVDSVGIVGLLLMAKKGGIIKDIKTDLDELRNGGYYLSDRVYRDVLRRMGELP